MPKTVSPLRYPGGKSCLLRLVTNILRENNVLSGHYIEPYAGGCGLALALLYDEHVSDIHINDLDVSVWSFWHCALNHTEELVEFVENVPITMDEWHKHKAILLASDTSNTLDLAFATFFLNRTNRSGVIKKAGVIGGLKQNGSYKMDCRFNRDTLVKRIRRVAEYRKRIHLSNKDAIPFMQEMDRTLPAKAFFCIDPPYFKQGHGLYTNYYGPTEHLEVADVILKLDHPWIVTYDNADEIKKLYSNHRQYASEINYYLHTRRIGLELLIPSQTLQLPNDLRKIDFGQAQA